MKPCVLFPLLATLVAGILADETAHQTEIRKIETGVDQLIYRIAKLENGIDARREPTKVRGYKSLAYRVSNVEGTGCRKDYFQCGGNDPQCVNNLLFCDGHKDCRNGADEEDCKLPIHAGDVFDGTVVYDNCGLGEIKTIQFTVDALETASFFTPVAKGRVTIHITKGDNKHDNDIALRSRGYYEFATHRLVVAPSGSDRLGFVCRFDGANYDECHAKTVQEASLNDCAKYVFRRRH
jgi:hypothetical protein